MKEFLKIKVPVLLGPTAVGKTDLALKLASDFGWEVLSCDSRQVYRHMDIGTAKPTLTQTSAIPHHLIDIIEPSESYSAYRFISDSSSIITSSANRGKTVLICGGTGLYFQSLSEGIGPQIESDPQLRAQLMSRGIIEGSESLHNELSQKDALAASKIHPNDLQRIVRALAVFIKTGVPLSQWQVQTEKPAQFEFVIVKLTEERELLYKKINNRVMEMVKMGLYEEFTALVSLGYHEQSPGMQCVGYKELFPLLRKEYLFKDAIELIQRNTRRYAKRQITWFSHRAIGLDITGKTPYQLVRDYYGNNGVFFS